MEGSVYIVDDDQASRESVSVLVGEMGINTKTFSSGEEFLNWYSGERPACLVTDMRMLGMTGLELHEELMDRGHHLSTVVLTAFAETRLTVRTIKSGAETLLEKPCRGHDLWEAIRQGLLNDTRRFDKECHVRDIQTRIESLTPSEKSVLDLIVQGLANKVIAGQLELSLRTIEDRRRQVFRKMNADSLAELVRLVVKVKGDFQ